MSKFVMRKYEEFYHKNGYVPKLFNPYNCYEVKDVAPTITSQCGSSTTTASVLVLVEENNENNKENRND